MIDVSEGQNAISVDARSSQLLKCGKPLGAKDKIPQERKAPTTLAELLQTKQENALI